MHASPQSLVTIPWANVVYLPSQVFAFGFVGHAAKSQLSIIMLKPGAVASLNVPSGTSPAAAFVTSPHVHVLHIWRAVAGRISGAVAGAGKGSEEGSKPTRPKVLTGARDPTCAVRARG